MTPEEVRAIRDAVGGTKAMAERLEVTERAVRQLLKRGASRRSTVGRIERLVEGGSAQ